MAFREGAATGVVVAGVVVVIMLLLRLLADVPTLPEVALDWLTLHLPVAVFGGVLRALGSAAKSLAFAALFGALMALGGAIGGVAGSLMARGRRRCPEQPAPGPSDVTGQT